MWTAILQAVVKYGAKLIVWAAEHPTQVEAAINVAKEIKEAKAKK